MGAAFVVGLVVGSLYILFGRSLTAAVAIATGIAIETVLQNRSRHRGLEQLATGRSLEAICTFARALDRRSSWFDAWVVRALRDALQPYGGFDEGQVPIRPEDRLSEDQRIDPEDSGELAAQVARRVGREASRWPSNPARGEVRTVGDLIRLVALQPRGT
jgi:hypothetical protein